MAKVRSDRNIFIRNLSRSQNVLLEKLRSDIGENVNTKAVWKAVEQHFALKAEIVKLRTQIQGLENQLSQAQAAGEELQSSVRDYFLFLANTEIERKAMVERVTKLTERKRK